jgi:outer membrane protein OmpA-like peptidoglycan-associated protein
MTTLKYALAFLLFGSTFATTAQNLSATVIDENTGEPIPFATVETGKNQGVITNEEGVFSFDIDKVKQPLDSVYISSMGYSKKGLSVKTQSKGTVKLAPKPFTLQSVFVSNKTLTAEEIVEKVKENLTANYRVNLSKKKIFFRQSDFNKMNKVNFGFQKSTIEELNKALIDSIARLIPRNSSYYREVVGDFYGDYRNHKFYVDKAAELYDKSKDVSIDGLSEKLERIFKENVKPDSYIKIKSGIFGTKVQLDSVAKANEDAKAIKVEVGDTDDQNFPQQIKDRISELYEQLFFHEDSKLDILEKSNRYKFTLEDYTFIDEVPVFILKFEPKGKKDFKGVMYVTTDDFAIVRLEFDNVRPLKKFGLLGITYRQNVYRGKMLFAKDPGGSYSPRYLELENGDYFGVKRPLKVIEKNKHVKGRRKQNELALELDVQTTNVNKYELVVFNSETITQGNYEAAVENKNVEATYLPKYDPTFWQGYTIMEPNAAIQAFEVIGE